MTSTTFAQTTWQVPYKWLAGVTIYVLVICGLHFGLHITLSDLFGLSLMPLPCYWLGCRQARQEEPCSAVRSALIWGACFFLILGSFIHYLIGMPYTMLLELTSAATVGYFLGWRKVQG